MTKGPPKLSHPSSVPQIEGMPAWWVLLKEWGLPQNVVVLDWETFFDKKDYSMGLGNAALSTIEYVMDQRFEEIGFSAVEMKQPFAPVCPTFWWKDGGGDAYIRHLQDEYGPNLEGCVTVAQNFVFDGTILSRKYGIVPAHPIDLLGLARHEDSREHNDLGALAKRHGLLPKGRTANFSGVHLLPKWDRQPGRPPKLVHAGMTPEQRDAMADYGCHDGRLEWELFTRYLPRLSNPGIELRLIQHTLDLFWKPTLAVDQAAAVVLTGKMQDRVGEIVKATGQTEDEISGNKSFGVLLGTALDAAGDKLDKYQKQNKKGEAILAIAKTDDELELLQQHPSERVRQLISARTAIKSWPNHIARVERIARQAKASGGLLPVPLKYCGAHTGRASGGEKINLQNLGSRGDPLITEIRHLLTAPEGTSLVIVDAAQIEARGVDWLAGEPLGMWQDPSRDPYCEFASIMSARTVLNTKKHKQALAALKKWHDRMRGMGKVGVLGCGYGMGAEKAQAYAANSYGVEMDLNEANTLVKTYRTTHPKVCKLWRVVEQKFKAAARYHEPGDMPAGEFGAVLKFHYEEQGDLTIITLPNGRTLKYPQVRVSIINGREQMWMPNPLKPGDRTFMWGGFLVENIVQAFCRDILMEAMLRLEDLAWHTALHVHDELVEVVPKDKAAECLKVSLVEMARTPVWAPGLPLAAEGKISQRYEK